jgi:glycosyltransferase involved in cell wall biosynthesis
LNSHETKTIFREGDDLCSLEGLLRHPPCLGNKPLIVKDLILLTEYYPYGAAEAFIENEIEFLAQRFRRVFILAMTRTGLEKRPLPDNVVAVELERPARHRELANAAMSPCYFKELIALLPSLRKPWFALNYLGKALSAKKQLIEIVHQHSLDWNHLVFYSYWLNEAALAIATIGDACEKVARAHRFDLYDYGNTFQYQPFQRKIISSLDFVLSCSNHGREYLRKKHPTYTDKIQTSYLGTKKPRRLPPPSNPGDASLIATCSALTETKRVDLIVKSIAEFKKKLPDANVEWVHIGDGPKLAEVKRLAKTMLSDITFNFTGPLPYHKVMEFYSNHPVSIFINLSSSEGIPVSIMEALSFGIPAIATDVGGVSEIVNEKTGILMDPNPEPEQVADAMKRVLSMDKNREHQFKTDCLDYWNNHFNASSNYDKFLEHYLLAHSKRSPNA